MSLWQFRTWLGCSDSTKCAGEQARLNTVFDPLRQLVFGTERRQGELLDEVVGGRSLITDSDQGRSFQAFYDLLLSKRRSARSGSRERA